jgi:hypothetical protein
MFRIERISSTPGQSHPAGFTWISDNGQRSYAWATSRIILVDFFQRSTPPVVTSVGGFPVPVVKPPEIA